MPTDALQPMVLAAMSNAPAVVVKQAQPVVPMMAIGLVLTATFVVIAFEFLHKTIAALIGAICAVALALYLGVYSGDHPYEVVHQFIEHDLGVIGVIVGTSILVEIAGASGLFHFIAIKLVKLTGGVPSRLFPTILAVTVAFVTFLTITPGVLIMVSLVLVITHALEDDPRPYVLAVAMGANSGALMTFASGIPTLMIGTAAHIPYWQFLVVSSPLALLSAVVVLFGIKLQYNGVMAVQGHAVERAAKVKAFDEWALVKDRTIFYRCAIILGLTIVGFSVAQQLGVGLDFIAIVGATAALLLSGMSPEETIRKVKWPVILFFVGLFVLIGTVRETGLLDLLAQQIYDISGSNIIIAISLMIPFVFVTAAIVDNIPVAATMIPVIQTMTARGLVAAPLWWTVIAACNLGGNPTPVGSIGAVIALHALERERDITIGWGEYLKAGGLVTIVQVVLVFAYLSAYWYLGLFPSL
jgi:Na+/H+ antiporter NhaD/arsenite permease-like protein